MAASARRGAAARRRLRGSARIIDLAVGLALLTVLVAVAWSLVGWLTG